MSDLVKDKATVCVVNYRTLELTRLCLRSIRKFTQFPYEVIVVDNDSQDESLQYLKSLKWIRLIERQAEAGEPGAGYAHAAALDVGLANCNTEFFISMHSDAFIQKANWLTNLIGYFDADGNAACVGSGKIELAPKWQILVKKVTDLRTFRRRLFREPDPVGKFRYYNRTICCLYRTDILKRENLSFNMGRDEGLASGKKLYFELVDRGYKTVELPASVMGQYVVHLAHATQVINPHEFTVPKKDVKKYNRLLDKVIASEIIQTVLTDESLDC